MEREIQHIEIIGQYMQRAYDWWNGLNGEDMIIRLLAYKKAFNVDINYPDEEQVMTLYYLEFRKKHKSQE